MLEGNARRLIGVHRPFAMPLHRPDEQQQDPNDDDDRERGKDSASHAPRTGAMDVPGESG